MSSEATLTSSPVSGPADFDINEPAELDPDFECDAPKFYDFVAEGLTSPAVADRWFESKKDTPLCDRYVTPEPLLGENEGFSDEDDSAAEDTFCVDGSEAVTPRQTAAPREQETSSEVEETRKSLGKLRPFTPKHKSELYKSVTAENLFDEQEIDDEPTPKPAKKTNATSTFVPTRSVKPLTIPVEFKFSNRNRPQKHSDNSSENLAKKSFTSSFKLKNTQKVTKTQPFRFHQSTARSVVKKDSPYVPLAERLRQVDKTPDRFKRNIDMKPIQVRELTKVAKLTKPQSPKLSTKLRSKTVSLTPTEDRLVRTLKEKGPFKARPLDLRVLNSAGDLGVPRVKKAELTIPHSPKINKPKPTICKEESPQKSFKAPPFVPPKRFQPKVEHRVLPIPEFKLPGDKISEKKKMEFEASKMKELKETENYATFKARPIQWTSKDSSGQASGIHRPLTNPKTPKLRTKQRGVIHRQVFQEKVQKELEEIENRANFKANTVPHIKPFVPSKSEREATENVPFDLRTDIRAEERKDFDLQLKRQQDEIERMQQLQQKERERIEKEEIRRLRKEMDFHAHPIMSTVVPFEPKKSAKPLTEPVSPYIGEKRKLMVATSKK